MKFLVAVAFLFTAVCADDDLAVDLGDTPMQNPDLFQGDILGIESVEDRNAIPYMQRRWPSATVYYQLDPAVVGYTSTILAAMENYHRNTCVKFKRRTTERNYINIFAGQGCYSYVGMTGGQQPISLGRGCMFVGTIVHELGHALGFFHEQNRSDRDKYLIIYWENIQPGMESQFALLKPHENLLLDTFDTNSIMLYGNTAFSKDRVSKTMVARSGVPLKETYDKPGLSASDIIRVKKMYRC